MRKKSVERMEKMRKHRTKDKKDNERQKDFERKGNEIVEMSEDQLIELGLKKKKKKKNRQTKFKK